MKVLADQGQGCTAVPLPCKAVAPRFKPHALPRQEPDLFQPGPWLFSARALAGKKQPEAASSDAMTCAGPGLQARYGALVMRCCQICWFQVAG